MKRRLRFVVRFCDGRTTNYTKYRYLAFDNGKCSGKAYENSTTVLGHCYTFDAQDSFDCYDPKFNVLKFYDCRSSDGSCRGNDGYYSQQGNGQCYPDYLQINSMMWVAE